MMLTRTLIVVFLGCGVMTFAQQPPAENTPTAADLVYDTFCKKDEKEKRRLFRAATRAQKSALARAQLERWRDANRARLSQEQLTVVQELWNMATPEMFEGTEDGKARLASFEARADAAFSGRQMDEISPYGPCIPAAAKK